MYTGVQSVAVGAVAQHRSEDPVPAREEKRGTRVRQERSGRRERVPGRGSWPKRLVSVDTIFRMEVRGNLSQELGQQQVLLHPEDVLEPLPLHKRSHTRHAAVQIQEQVHVFSLFHAHQSRALVRLPSARTPHSLPHSLPRLRLVSSPSTDAAAAAAGNIVCVTGRSVIHIPMLYLCRRSCAFACMIKLQVIGDSTRDAAAATTFQSSKMTVIRWQSLAFLRTCLSAILATTCFNMQTSGFMSSDGDVQTRFKSHPIAEVLLREPEKGRRKRAREEDVIPADDTTGGHVD